jgi:hypothetical protein
MSTLVLSNHMGQIEQALLSAGKPFIVAMTREHAEIRRAASRRPLPYEVIPVSAWDAFGEIAELARELRGSVSTVATRWEGALMAAGLVRDVLGLPGQSLREAAGYTDKGIMKQRLRAGGIPVAGHRVIRSPRDVIGAAYQIGGFPVVVKPLRGFASTNTHIIRSVKELAELTIGGVFDTAVEASPLYAGDRSFEGLAKQQGFLVESYVDIAEEYHCDGLWIDGEPAYQFPGIYHTPPLHGMGGMLGSALLDTSSRRAKSVIDMSVAAARTLGAGTGFTHAEIFRTTDDRWLIGEIAARPGGGGIQRAIQLAHGIDVNAIQAAIAADDPADVSIQSRPGTVGWAGPAVPPGRVVEIAAREKLLGHPGVLDATVAVSVGQLGGRTGSGLWGGLAGYVFLHGDTPAQVLEMMAEATARYHVRVERLTPAEAP